MATIDTSLITGYKGVNPWADYQQGMVNKAAQDQRDIETQRQQQVLNQASQQTAAGSYELAQKGRDAAYQAWDNQQTDFNVDPQTGRFDSQGYLAAATKAGFRTQALAALATHQPTLDQVSTSRTTGQAQLLKDLTYAANQMQGMSDAQKAPYKQEIAKRVQQTYGVDIKNVVPDNWDTSLLSGQYSPAEFAAQTANYNTPEGLSPTSKTSVALRNLINSRGGQVPETASAFQIMNTPAYKEMYDQIPQAARVQAIGNIAASEQSKQAISTLIDRIDALNNDPLIRPGEYITQLIARLGNTPENAKLTQVVDELKAQGIEVTPNMSLVGAKDSLKAKLVGAESAQAGQRAIAGSTNINAALTTPPIGTPSTNAPTKSANGAKRYLDIKNNRVVTLTPAQVELLGKNPNGSKFYKPMEK